VAARVNTRGGRLLMKTDPRLLRRVGAGATVVLGTLLTACGSPAVGPPLVEVKIMRSVCPSSGGVCPLEAVEGATVTLRQGARRLAEGRTDAKGLRRLKAPGPGTYTVTARLDADPRLTHQREILISTEDSLTSVSIVFSDLEDVLPT
jgi:hypothetical protein